MREFTLAKKGYDREEVDKYVLELEEKLELKEQLISSLKRELDVFYEQDKEIKQKSENIAIALTAAVEKHKDQRKPAVFFGHRKAEQPDWERNLTV